MERRRELALLRALGYKQVHIFAIVIAENLLLLLSGLVIGIVCSLLAIGPVLVERAGSLPVLSLIGLLSAVLAVGLAVSFAATFAAIRSPLLAGLRSE
jgi:putative ABC transport system permease protein